MDHTSGWFGGCVAELAELVRGGGRPSSGGREARTALEILLAALQSQARNGVRVGWPIADARRGPIVGAPEAAWVSVEGPR